MKTKFLSIVMTAVAVMFSLSTTAQITGVELARKSQENTLLTNKNDQAIRYVEMEAPIVQ